MNRVQQAFVAMLFPLALLGQAPRTEAPATLVGAETCAGCHAGSAAAWQSSHHALAMQAATPATVLGDFSGVTFEHFGLTSTFTREGDRFLVRTDGPDGTLQQFQVAYTFGVDPLQQYLIALPGGRLQALGIAWDTRPKAEGGQRWYPLYPDQRLRAGDRLHWTGRDQTWNHMCADCHSTGLRRNFDLATNTYATSWAEPNVTCEACHGPGSRHVAWAKATPGVLGTDLRKGITAWLRATDLGTWQMNAETGIAQRSVPLVSGELDSCVGCHARRKVIASDAPPGTPFLDTAIPALLEPGLYHADGQIDGEVFEYGSFVQSRMHRAGVTCSNCHEPHTSALRAKGNAVCTQCHAPSRFEAVSHHHHEAGSAGAQCVSCHMATKTYMGVDVRHDHSLRVPRPDLSVAIGVPNACTQCHTDRAEKWAAQAVAAWFPQGRQTTPHFGLALHAGRSGARDAEFRLSELIRDTSQPGIARATALGLLQRYLSPASAGAVRSAVTDADPIVRMAAPRALPSAPTPQMAQAIAPLLSDPVRAVRVEAARALSGADAQAMGPAERRALAAAHQELMQGEMVDADQPEAHLNLGLVALRQRDPAAAEAAYRTALRLDPAFVPSLVNLADLERSRGREPQSVDLLRQALALEPNNADARHALGLALIRQRDYAGALVELKRASTLAPGNARYAYVQAIALSSLGAKPEAAALLEEIHRQHPTNRESLLALMAMARDAGDAARAIAYAKELVALDRLNPDYARLLTELQQRWPRAVEKRP